MITLSVITALIIKYVGGTLTTLASLIVSVFFGIINLYMSYWSLIINLTKDRDG